MTRQELRVKLSWMCGCGSPERACAALLTLLRFHPLYENRGTFEAFIPDSGLQYLVLYMLDHLDLTEHGGTVGGGWLTDDGKAVCEALGREEADHFEVLTASACMHGYAVDTDELLDCPECSPLNKRSKAQEPTHE